MKLLFDESGKNLPNKKIDAKQQYALVVEDDPDTNQLINIVLTTGGFEVYPAWNGLEAMHSLSSLHPDVIVLDLMMPRMDGWAVLEQLRTSKMASKIPVVVLTALHDADCQQRARTLGAKDYVKKPFAPGDLVSRVKALVVFMPATKTPKRTLGTFVYGSSQRMP